MLGAVVQRLQRNEPYYEAMRTELRAGGYPTASIFNWRTPLHLSFLASATMPGARVILAAIAVAAVVLLLPMVPSPRATILAVGVPLVASTILVTLSEAWAGALIALSMGAYVRRQWALAAVCGVLAVFVRELAAVYALVGAGLALHGRRKGESLIWVLGGAAYVAYYGWHVQQVLATMPPDAQSHGASWVQWGGLSFVLRTVECYGWASLAPAITAPLVVAAGLLGVTSRQMPLHARFALMAYLGAFSVVGLPVNRYWGLITVPLWGVGIVYAASGAQRVAASMGLPAANWRLSLRRVSQPHSFRTR